MLSICTSCYRNGDSVTEPPFSMAKYDTVRAPAKTPTDRKGLYMLSNLDQTLCFPSEVLFAFKANKSLINVNVGGILKQSLSKALEVYYPLAGRLKLGFDGKLVVDCDVEEGGVPFAEAISDEDMAAIGDITMIDQKLVRKLVYPKPNGTILDVPPLAIQVTRFRCGGMILGVRLNHVMFDGTGLTDFMKSWSEFARGFPLSIKPHLDRSILSPRNPPKVHFSHPEYSKLERSLISPLQEKIIVQKSFSFTPTMISRLRKLARETNEPVSRSPTTFELISALAWICWTKAKKLDPNEMSRIGIAVDGRHKLQPPMPKGYFGNGIFVPCAQSRARDLTSKPFSYAVGTMHDPIKRVTGDYIRSVIDFLETTRKPLEENNLVWISKLTRIPFYEIDFGWGVATQFASGAIMENLVVVHSHGKDSKNLVISLALSVDAMEVFQELITSQLNED